MAKLDKNKWLSSDTFDFQRNEKTGDHFAVKSEAGSSLIKVQKSKMSEKIEKLIRELSEEEKRELKKALIPKAGKKYTYTPYTVEITGRIREANRPDLGHKRYDKSIFLTSFTGLTKEEALEMEEDMKEKRFAIQIGTRQKLKKEAKIKNEERNGKSRRNY